MKEIKVIEGQVFTTREKIMEFANSIKVNLPDEYVSFLLKHNGGHPENDAFDLIEPVWNDLERGKTAGVDWFLALYDGEYNNLERSYIRCENTDFFPIAYAPGGNLICLCIKGKNYGKVYYWDFNTNKEEDYNNIAPTYNHMYLVANSFTEFINSFYKEDLAKNKDGDNVWIATYDKYSLPKSHHIRRHGKAITDFFDKAPKEVEKFIIKEFTANGDLLLSFKSGGKEHFRRLNKDGKIIEEYQN